MEGKIKDLTEEGFKVTQYLQGKLKTADSAISQKDKEHIELEERYNHDRDALLEEHRERYNSNLLISSKRR